MKGSVSMVERAMGSSMIYSIGEFATLGVMSMVALRRACDDEGTIRETPGVSNDYPCIGNTWIPVRTVVQLYVLTGDVDVIADELPQLTRQQIDGALAWYRTPPGRVDEDIARNEATLAHLRAR